MRILVVGAGSIGGTVAGEVIQAGGQVTLVTGRPANTEAINEKGIHIKTPERDFRVDAKAVDRASQLGDERFDAILLATKADAVVETASEAAPFLAEEGFIATLQNGIVGGDVAEAVGGENVVSISVGFAATMHGPGDYERTSGGKLHIGELEGPATARVRRLAKWLEAVTEVEVEDNMAGALWAKLAINSGITSIGALTGLTLGASLRYRSVRDAFMAIYSETIDTAVALGVTPEKIAADPWLLYLPKDAGFPTRLYKHLIARVVGAKYRKLKSSSLQSLERGRKTEMPHINGRVVKAARSIGREAPANQAVCDMVEELESGQRGFGLENVDELLRRLAA
jgi:2-dehydropantoate 2-reductase